MKLLVYLFLFLSIATFGADLNDYLLVNRINDETMSEIISLIEVNETGGKQELLVHWNKGEGFASLGIGHFIWYPNVKNKKYQESFPKLIHALKKLEVSLPGWLEGDSLVCPWNDINDFQKAKRDRDYRIQDLEKLLSESKFEQMEFILERAQKAIPEILESLSEDDKHKVVQVLDALVKTSGGIYAIIDYTNFKGEGTSEKERYNNVGWGLAQVLLEIDIDAVEYDPMAEFVRSAKNVLDKRIEASPKARNEGRWRKGWHNRIDRYLNLD